MSYDKDGFGIKNPAKVDMPLSKIQTNPKIKENKIWLSFMAYQLLRAI